ncbi:MAG: cupin domain-containing protein [Actinomycetota bacterium]|nr:cupin domain-containing protein [Actinomycetota bacterium]
MRVGRLVVPSPLPAIDDPATGQRIVFLQTGETTGGELLECDLFVAPGGFVPLHMHPHQEERFEAISGYLRFRLGRERRVVAAGEVVVARPRTAHWFRNESDREAHFRVLVSPAWRTEHVLLLIGLARDGLIRMRKHGYPTPLLQAAVLGTGPLDEVCLPFVPLGLQKAAFRALAPLGRALGYRSVFPEYRPGAAAWPSVSP